MTIRHLAAALVILTTAACDEVDPAADGWQPLEDTGAWQLEAAVPSPIGPRADLEPSERPVEPPIGRWASAPCEGRDFWRELTVDETGQFVVEDLIEPCPPDVLCSWSGVVTYEGDWRMDGPTLILDEHVVSPPGAPWERVQTLVVDASGPRELDADCTYERF